MSVLDDTALVLRTEWLKIMSDTITITRTTDRGTFNATTGDYDTPTSGTIYTGVGRVRAAKTGGDQIDFGQQEITELVYIVDLPYTADGIQPDDQLTVDTSPLDTDLVGKTMRVLAVDHTTRNTHRHVTCALNLGAGTP